MSVALAAAFAPSCCAWAVAAPSGVAETYQGEASGAAAPAPTALTARSLKRYSLPLVRSYSVCDVVDAPLLNTRAHALYWSLEGATRKETS